MTDAAILRFPSCVPFRRDGMLRLKDSRRISDGVVPCISENLVFCREFVRLRPKTTLFCWTKGVYRACATKNLGPHFMGVDDYWPRYGTAVVQSELLTHSVTRYFRHRRRHLLACSDADDARLQADLAEGYLRFLQAKDENKRMEGTRLAKRTKKAKVLRKGCSTSCTHQCSTPALVPIRLMPVMSRKVSFSR